MKKEAKQRNIRTRIMGGIVFIMLLTVLIPILAYYLLPEWAYYLSPGTRLWLATEEVNSSYGTPEFFETLKDVEKKVDSTVEIYTADGRFVYSSRALLEELPHDLSAAKTVDAAYRNNYTLKFGEEMKGAKGFQILESEQLNSKVQFLNCYQFLPGGERVEICMQVSQLTSTSKIDFVVSFVIIMLVLIVALLVFSVYIKRLTQPIKTMCTITDNMAQLNFSERCPPTRMLEITELAQSINQLSDALDRSLTDLQDKNRQLQEDIENERTIDNLRQTFISGISHELKTPIAIIQGYAEGAKMFYASGNAEAADNYCDVIAEEAGRMNAMIMKLLEITKYSSGAYEPIREDFALYELTQDWFDRNGTILAEQDISWTNNVPAAWRGNGDRLILSSVVNNYLSNAVSHADGEKKIVASSEDLGDRYRVYIYNTGKHIQDKDIDKIWTSFYRADKSLSRSQGRFGLGLAIVAAIQQLHGMDYGVENVEGGVRFWFDVAKSGDKETAE